MVYTFGEKIRKLRKQMNLSQKEFAKQSGVPVYTIIALENNRSNVPLITTVMKFAKYFKISVDELLAEVEINI